MKFWVVLIKICGKSCSYWIGHKILLKKPWSKEGPSNDLKVNSEHICLFHTVLSSLRCHGTCPVLTVLSFSKLVHHRSTVYSSVLNMIVEWTLPPTVTLLENWLLFRSPHYSSNVEVGSCIPLPL